MLEILSAIGDFLLSIVVLISNTLMSIVWVITSIPKFVTTITAVFAYCPTQLLAFLEISLALIIVFAIIKLL